MHGRADVRRGKHLQLPRTEQHDFRLQFQDRLEVSDAQVFDRTRRPVENDTACSENDTAADDMLAHTQLPGRAGPDQVVATSPDCELHMEELKRSIVSEILHAHVRELTLIVTDLFIDKDAADPQSLPLLPGLSRLLACARPESTGDWRRWVMHELAATDCGQIPVAALSHAALSPPEGESASREHWWLATPVHLEPDLTCVRMGARPVELDDEEWRCIGTEFNRLFGKDGFQLRVTARAVALLAASAPIDAVTTDPARVLGQNIEPSLPSGAAGALLRRMMTGIQMWLHEHPVNLARARRGLPAANALWVWGGGQLPALPAPVELPRLLGPDLFLQGLWRILQGEIEAPSASLESAVTRGDCMVVALSALEPARAPAEVLTDMDRDWLAPALRALRTGRIASLALHLNDRLFRASRLDTFRFWRRHRLWRELAA